MDKCILLTEYQQNPLGITESAPRLSWDKQISQTGYQIQVIKEKNLKYDIIWDSGIVAASEPFCHYAGQKLESLCVYSWKVRLIDESGVIGPWSEEASFETALIDPNLWNGCFIGIPTSNDFVALFRHIAHIGKAVRRARAYLAVEGYAELWINARKAGLSVLEPSNTDYQKKLLYLTYDITGLLQSGQNAIGVRLNRGWAKFAKFLLQIYIHYADGTIEGIYSSPESWVTAISSIRSATVYSGEVYDARLENPYWNEPSDEFEKRYPLKPWGLFANNYNNNKPEDSFYSFPAMEMPSPCGILEAQNIEPIQIMGELTPIGLNQAPDGSWVVDFGQNFSGWVRQNIKAKRGDRITISHSELLNSDGTLNMLYLTVADPNYPLPMQTDTYIASDDKYIIYEPRFTYHGFRYAAINGLGYEPSISDFTGILVHSAVKQIGNFYCGSDLLGQIYKAIVWSEKTNLHSIPTDCPQRAERQGWLNDMTARAEAAVYINDMRLFYSKFLGDIYGTQDPVSGAITDTAPYRRGNYPADPVSCYLLIPYLLYMHYGDKRLISRYYESMKKLTNYWDRNAKNGILFFSLYGDWASPEEHCISIEGNRTPVSSITPGDFISSCYLYYYMTLIEKFAQDLGKSDDRRKYADRSNAIRESIVDTYYNQKTGQFANGSQAANAIALYMGVLPEENYRIAKNLANDVIEKGYMLTTGNLCTKYLLEMLSEYGYVDIAYKLSVRTQYPSWGYMLEKGATTIWERWENATGFGMNSHNHPMYGSISAWMYKYLAGISPIEPGYKKTLIKPYIPQELSSAGADLQTIYGKIACNWIKKDEELIIKLDIPPGVSALVSLPGENVTSCGVPVMGTYEGGRTVMEYPNGTYNFTIRS